MIPFSFVLLLSTLHQTGPLSFLEVVSVTVLINSDLPHDQLYNYFIENEVARLECSVTNSTTTETPASSRFYKIFTNGTEHQFTQSGRVLVDKNALVFWPKVLNGDQGWYYCCVSDKCSNSTHIKLLVTPMINATRENYTAFIGSLVSLSCEIINWGDPKAVIHWKRFEEYLSNDFITINNTHTSLILPNVTEQDGGKYVCVAVFPFSRESGELYLSLQVPPQLIMSGPMIAHIGEVVNITCTRLKGQPVPDIYISTPTGEITKNDNVTFSATIQHTGDYVCTASISTLTVTKKHYLLVYDIDNTTSYLQFLVLIRSHDCHFKYENTLSVILKEHISEICNCNVSISTERFYCISDARALYYVKIFGIMAGNIKKLLQNEELAIDLDSSTLALHICDPPCEEQTDNSYHINQQNTIATWMASAAVAILTMIIVIFIIYKVYKFLNRGYIAQEETSNATTNPLAREHQTTFEQSHLTNETILEDNEAIPSNDNEIVASNDRETVLSVQSNGNITTAPIAISQRNISFTQTDRGNGLGNSKHENMTASFATNFASTGTDV